MTHAPQRRAPALALMLPLAAALLSGAALGGDRERAPRVPPLPQYASECAACHLAYPPGMLPAASWSRLMGSLAEHYGTDASLDERDLQPIRQWLAANADPRRLAPPPQDRITRTDWFVREHRRIEAATWRLPSVRSAANCAACHTGTERGQFSEHGLRQPEGLSARQRASWGDD